jgi:DNA-binding response OmpR family regulator
MDADSNAGPGASSEHAPGARVLVVEDHGPSAALVRQFLEREGYAVVEAADGPAALRSVTAQPCDAVVLDLGLPGLDGMEVLRALRRDSGVPVIVLTARDEEASKLAGFDAGADDYVVKPFSFPELGARLRAVLRRGEPAGAPEPLEIGGLVVDVDAGEVHLDGEPVVLTAKEFALLAYLAAAAGRCVRRDELLHHVWGSAEDWQDPATVTEHIRRLRRKIDPDPRRPRFIETVRGMGYRFAATEGYVTEGPAAEESAPA